MQERLEKWRKNAIPVPAVEKVRGKPTHRFKGKGDFGDANSQEDWDDEVKKSQTRR